MRKTAVAVAEPDEPSTPQERRAWYLYDWANSAFSTTVVTLFLGPYLTAIAKSAAGADGFLHPFGFALEPRAYWSFLVSLSVITQVLVMPLVGSLADYGNRKREMLGGLTYTGALATIAMFFVEGKAYLFGGALFLLANLSFGCAIVVYNSFLPELATAEERDSVSSRGWAIGYIGGGLLLALNLVFFGNAARIGVSEGFAVRVSIASAGVWWALFTWPAMRHLKNRGAQRSLPRGESIFTVGWRQFRATLLRLRRYPQTILFLGAYLLYNDAIQTVISLAGQFGADELKMPMSQLSLAILMVQFVDFFGAMGFGKVAARTGAKQAVMVSLVIWTATLLYMYLAVTTPRDFFILAALVAIVMGGSQALSRAIFAQLVPPGAEAEYFSIYEIADKGTSWMGPLVVGFALQFTGQYRVAILSLIFFFVAGLVLLARVDVEQGSREALL